MKKIGIIPFTDANGQKHLLDVYDDGRAVLPDGSSRKLKKEIFDALMKQYNAASSSDKINEPLMQIEHRDEAERESKMQEDAPAAPDESHTTIAVAKPAHKKPLRLPQKEPPVQALKDFAEQQMPVVSSDEQPADSAEDRPQKNVSSNLESKITVEKKPADSDISNIGQANPTDTADGFVKGTDTSNSVSEKDDEEPRAKKKWKKQEEKNKKGRSKKVAAILVSLAFIVSLLGGAGYIVYKRGGIFNSAFQMMDGQQAINTNGVVKIEYFAVITDANGIEHQVKLSSLTLNDLELTSIEDASGRSMLN